MATSTSTDLATLRAFARDYLTYMTRYFKKEVNCCLQACETPKYFCVANQHDARVYAVDARAYAIDSLKSRREIAMRLRIAIATAIVSLSTLFIDKQSQ